MFDLIFPLKDEKQNFEKVLNIIFQNFHEKANNNCLEYTLLRKLIIIPIYFEKIVCPFIKDKNQRQIILKAYHNFFFENRQKF